MLIFLLSDARKKQPASLFILYSRSSFFQFFIFIQSTSRSAKLLLSLVVLQLKNQQERQRHQLKISKLNFVLDFGEYFHCCGKFIAQFKLLSFTSFELRIRMKSPAVATNSSSDSVGTLGNDSNNENSSSTYSSSVLFSLFGCSTSSCSSPPSLTYFTSGANGASRLMSTRSVPIASRSAFCHCLMALDSPQLTERIVEDFCTTT